MHIAVPIQTQKIDIIQSCSNFPSMFTPKNIYPKKMKDAQMKNLYHILKITQLRDFFKNCEI